MLMNSRFIGGNDWLRNQDLNLRPSGYEFDSIENLNYQDNTINKAFYSLVSLFDTNHKTKYSHLFYFFCQAVKSLTRKNCTNNCTDINLKENFTSLLRGWNYTSDFIKLNLMNINFTNKFTTSRLNSRPNYIQVVKTNYHIFEYFLCFSRLHDLILYIFVFKKFFLFILFFLNLIELFNCEVVKTTLKYYKKGFSFSRLVFLSRELSREVVKDKL